MSVEDLFSKASALFALGKYHEAIQIYTTISEGDGDGLSSSDDHQKARALNNISACCASLKDYPKSLVMAEAALRLSPENTKAMGRVATAQEALQHYEEALDFFQRAKRGDPENASYAAGVERCEALLQSRRGVASASTRDSYYYAKCIEKGKTAMMASQYMEAIRNYGKAIHLFPADCPARERAVLFSNRSAAYFRAERMEESAADGQEATNVDGTYSRGFFRLAAAKAKLKMFGDAYAALRRCLEIDPNHAEAKVLFEEVRPAAEEEGKTATQRAQDNARRVADLQEKMNETYAAKSDAVLTRGTAYAASYAYCSYCNDSGHVRAECPLLRRKRQRPG